MNENIDLTKILKDCPIGFKLYTPLIGEVEFIKVRECTLPVLTLHSSGIYVSFTKEGSYFNFNNIDAECLLLPSAEQRDWSKFTAPGLKKKKFDPKTLQPFDKVLVRDAGYKTWKFDLFSHIVEEEPDFPYVTISKDFRYCIPYNDETKHLVGKIDEAPEFYICWED